ncbi:MULTISPECIES: hypothetical protein [unclassified Roseofilum]|uniref:hypothetical protein n=1 Tax=unclassified Roseofilum TaxID=2620099 RepID=UPI001B1243B7|nr:MULTISPECIES: hypothetical protein [unclassified Roseofilum]MBP0010699.1 hypothetical protein [Roseofilum sp. Belize Diploria]MBP0035239.1 hypothetical protein [Roseofilum sp. Belize BBD 4]
MNLDKIDRQIQLLKKSDKHGENKWFIAMLEAIRGFMLENSEQEKFILKKSTNFYPNDFRVYSTTRFRESGD